MALTTPFSSGWMTRTLPPGIIFPSALVMMSTCPRIAHDTPTVKIATVTHSSTLGAGCGGFSSTSSDGGRKSRRLLLTPRSDH